LVTGLEGIHAGLPVLGICVRNPRQKQIEAVHGLVSKTTHKLGIPDIDIDRVDADDGYVGEGYGIPNEGPWKPFISWRKPKESCSIPSIPEKEWQA